MNYDKFFAICLQLIVHISTGKKPYLGGGLGRRVKLVKCLNIREYCFRINHFLMKKCIQQFVFGLKLDLFCEQGIQV